MVIGDLEVVVLLDQPTRKAPVDAALAADEALAGLVRSHGRGVRLVLAEHLDRWSAIEQMEIVVWKAAHKEQTLGDDPTTLLHTTARAAAVTYLEQADRQAIQERDVLRRLVVQVALDDLRGRAAAVSPVAQIQDRLDHLPSDQRKLLDLYYTRSMALQHLAAQRNVQLADLAHEACVARVACDWRSTVQAPADDRLLHSLTEDLLSDTLDPDSRALLAASVAKDLGRSVRLERQVRLHLLLRALLGPFAQHEVQHIVNATMSHADQTRTPAQKNGSSGRTRVRHSEVIRSPTSSRRPVGHPSANKSQPLLFAAAIGAGVLVLGVLLLPGRKPPPDKPAMMMTAAATAAELERVSVASPPEPTPMLQVAPVRGGSVLRPQQLATPSVIPPLPSEPTQSTTPVSATTTATPVTPAVVVDAAPPIETVTLMNADTDQPIAGYENLAQDVTIRLSQLPTRRINFLFDSPAEIKSIVFTLPGCSLTSAATEKKRPFSLANEKSDYRAWTPPPGSYILTLSACSDAYGKKVVRKSSWRIRFEE